MNMVMHLHARLLVKSMCVYFILQYKQLPTLLAEPPSLSPAENVFLAYFFLAMSIIY